MVVCPFCGCEKGFSVEKKWRFRFYEVFRMRCPRCKGVFNYYSGVSPRTGKKSVFVIRVKSCG